MDAQTVTSPRAFRRATPAGAMRRRRRHHLLRHIFRRREVTTFQRCLAVHMYFAEHTGTMLSR